ncbi:hypothetical protein IQ07DRAFT_103228 [Pyrenochaeta sp. DS3sAY3a]|nr:hypothetical protein IQ07DRAFT_103228 [Pyrenochaeta sp. DS3sAY3a]
MSWEQQQHDVRVSIFALFTQPHCSPKSTSIFKSFSEDSLCKQHIGAHLRDVKCNGVCGRCIRPTTRDITIPSCGKAADRLFIPRPDWTRHEWARRPLAFPRIRELMTLDLRSRYTITISMYRRHARDDQTVLETTAVFTNNAPDPGMHLTDSPRKRSAVYVAFAQFFLPLVVKDISLS